jgi:hypothetical protein
VAKEKVERDETGQETRREALDKYLITCMMARQLVRIGAVAMYEESWKKRYKATRSA